MGKIEGQVVCRVGLWPFDRRIVVTFKIGDNDVFFLTHARNFDYGSWGRFKRIQPGDEVSFACTYWYGCHRLGQFGLLSKILFVKRGTPPAIVRDAKKCLVCA